MSTGIPPVNPRTPGPTVYFVSLGCPKNRVDTEVMLGVAERSGYRHVPEPDAADVIVVNTCGFIDAAKKESIDTILELAEHKRAGTCSRLVVTGCLSQRYPEELAAELDEVDHFLGSSDMLRLEQVLAGGAERMLVGNPADWVIGASDPRRVTTRGASAYVKLAEGCNRSCAFCVIPELRGKQRSRRPDDIVSEVERLAAAGVVEVNLVSQDTVAYGRDLGHGAPSLASVVERIADVSGIKWVRLFYLYPERLDDGLVELLADHPRVVPYVDMPLQHASSAMLKRMRRGYDATRLRQLVELLHERIDGLTFRTAFIAGHPGETAEEFAELVEFVRWAEFDHVGVFRYSDEPSAASYGLDAKVSARVAEQRAKKLMSVQRVISKQKNRARIGRELDVLVEGTSDESELVLSGRHSGQAPEIDGVVYLSGGPALPGQMRRVRIVGASDYDLHGEVIDSIENDATSRAATPHLAHRASDGRRVSLRVVS